VGFKGVGEILQGEKEVLVHDYFDSFESTWTDWIAPECIGYLLEGAGYGMPWGVGGCEGTKRPFLEQDSKSDTIEIEQIHY
jgi:hypothetical protein